MLYISLSPQSLIPSLTSSSHQLSCVLGLLIRGRRKQTQDVLLSSFQQQAAAVYFLGPIFLKQIPLPSSSFTLIEPTCRMQKMRIAVEERRSKVVCWKWMGF